MVMKERLYLETKQTSCWQPELTGHTSLLCDPLHKTEELLKPELLTDGKKENERSCHEAEQFTILTGGYWMYIVPVYIHPY